MEERTWRTWRTGVKPVSRILMLSLAVANVLHNRALSALISTLCFNWKTFAQMGPRHGLLGIYIPQAFFGDAYWRHSYTRWKIHVRGTLVHGKAISWKLQETFSLIISSVSPIKVLSWNFEMWLIRGRFKWVFAKMTRRVTNLAPS